MGEVLNPEAGNHSDIYLSPDAAKSPSGLDIMDKIILDWLVRSGFQRAFEKMPTAKVFSDGNTVTLTDRASNLHTNCFS